MGATLQKRGKKFYVVVTKKPYRTARTFNDMDSAKRYRANVEVLLALGKDNEVFCPPPDNAGVTVAEYWPKWIADTNTRWKANTEALYEAAYRNHIRPFLGEVPIKSLTYPTIKAFVRKMRESMSGDTAKVYLTPLRGMLNEAVKEGIIAANPCSKIEVPTEQKSLDEDSDVDAYTDSEIAKLLETARKRSFRDYLIVLVAVRAGLRESEICGLQPDAIDFHTRRIRVKRQVYHKRVDTPKSKRNRWVDMSQALTAALKTAVENKRLEEMVNGNVTPWLFMNRYNSGPMDSGVMASIWNDIVTLAGVRRLVFHKLRHTYASALIARGARIEYVQEQLGHANILITREIYGHLFPGQYQHIADALDAPVAKKEESIV